MDTSMTHLDAMIANGYRGDFLEGPGISDATHDHERSSANEWCWTAMGIKRRVQWSTTECGTQTVLVKSIHHMVAVETDNLCAY